MKKSLREYVEFVEDFSGVVKIFIFMLTGMVVFFLLVLALGILSMGWKPVFILLLFTLAGFCLYKGAKHFTKEGKH